MQTGLAKQLYPRKTHTVLLSSADIIQNKKMVKGIQLYFIHFCYDQIKSHFSVDYFANLVSYISIKKSNTAGQT